jgi:hypothetical protein
LISLSNIQEKEFKIVIICLPLGIERRQAKISGNKVSAFSEEV